MIKKLFHKKNGQENAALLNRIEELLTITRKAIACDIAEKLKTVNPVEFDESPLREAPPILLSPRENAVLERVVLGKYNKEIAAEIFLSEGGVKNIMTTLLKKFGQEDRVQLAVSAVVNHMIPEEILSIYKK